MSFQVWDNQSDAQTSLDAINTAYGCPYKAINGYVMDEWDFVTKSDAGNEWGFTSAENRLGKTTTELNKLLVDGYVNNDNKPDNWLPEEV